MKLLESLERTASGAYDKPIMLAAYLAVPIGITLATASFLLAKSPSGKFGFMARYLQQVA